MRRLLIALAVCVFAFCAAAAEPTARTHFFSVEYEKAAAGGVPVVHATFFVPIEKDAARALLLSQLSWIVENLKPETDVLTSAWDREGNRIPLADEEKPCYDAMQKQIVSWADYLAAREK